MINNENAVELRDIEMHFNMSKERLESLKEYVLKFMKRELRFEDFVALNKISFDIKKGDVFGKFDGISCRQKLNGRNITQITVIRQ